MSESRACDCGQKSVARALATADIVVSGEIVSLIEMSDLNSIGITTTGDTASFAYQFLGVLDKYVYRVKVDTILKGKVSSDTISIVTAAGGCGLRLRLERGKQYVIYGTREDETIRKEEILAQAGIRLISTNMNTYWTSKCMRVVETTNGEMMKILQIRK
jgi:hypothetical protein